MTKKIYIYKKKKSDEIKKRGVTVDAKCCVPCPPIKPSISSLNETVRVVLGVISDDEISLLILCINCFFVCYTSNYDFAFNCEQSIF